VWNCNGLTERELKDPDSIDKISKNDIVILSEAWTDCESNIDIVRHVKLFIVSEIFYF
jgi:hypothetical protein